MRKSVVLSGMAAVFFFSTIIFAETPADINKNTQVKEVSLENVTALALANSLDIKLAKYDLYIKRHSLNKSLSVFDTYLNALSSYKKDESEQSSSFFGSKTTENINSINLEKKLPTGTKLSLNAQDIRSDTNSSFVAQTPLHEASAGISISQPLGRNFFGLSDRSIVKITKEDIESAEYTSLDSIEQNIADVQRAYWNFILKSEELAIKRDVLSEAEKLYSIYKNKFRLGLVEKADLLAAEANTYVRKNDIEGALLGKEKAKNQLLFLLNEDSDSVVLKGADSLDIETEVSGLYNALTEAQLNRRDYIKVSKMLAINDTDIITKKNARWPVIDLTASFAKNGIDREFGDAWNAVTGEDNTELYIGASFSVPLGNRNASSEYKSSKLRKEQLLLLLKKVERQILLSISDAVAQANTLKRNVDISRKLVSIQSKKLKEEHKRFNLGRSQSDILIRSEEDLLRARLMLASSLFQYRTSLVSLERAKNTLLDKYFKEQL